MPEEILIGNDDRLERAPADQWRDELQMARPHIAGRLKFMSADHHRVRRFAVSELVRSGAPVEPQRFAQALDLAPQRVNAILDDLARGLFFLVRDRRGRVTWAFPVTAERTTHHLRFNTGERVFGA